MVRQQSSSNTDQEKIIKKLFDIFACLYDEDPERFHKIYNQIKTRNSPLKDFPFQQLLSEAIYHLGEKKALELFRNHDPKELNEKARFVRHFQNHLHLSTIDWLMDLTKSYVSYFKSNKDILIQTGYPRTAFYKDPTFDWNETLLFPTKALSWVKRLYLKNGDEIIVYPWDRFSQKLKAVLPVDINYLDWPEDTCSYTEVPLLAGMKLEASHRLESARSTFYNFKMKILEESLLRLKNNNCSGILDYGLKLISDKMTRNDIDYYLSVENYYEKMISTGYDGALPIFVQNTGGLLELFLIMRRFEEMTTVRVFEETRQAFGNLIKKNSLNNFSLSVQSYFSIVGKLKQKQIVDKAFTVYISKIGQLNQFRKDFVERITDALDNEFQVEYTLKSKPKYLNIVMPHLLKAKSIVDDVETKDQEMDFDFKELEKSIHKVKPFLETKFPKLPNLQWHEVVITFKDNETIEVTAREERRMYHYSAIGFSDDRKSFTPDTRWDFLKKVLARNGGRIYSEGVINRDLLKAVIKELRKRLKFFMRIDDDPFHPFYTIKNEGLAYKTKFILRDETPERTDDNPHPE